jgi:SNF2 family DNA or RNA helicase
MGKTAAILGLILSEKKTRRKGCNLVVTPSHLFAQWHEEIDKFCAGKVKVIAGLKQYNETLANQPSNLADNHTIVLVDVQDVLNSAHLRYDWRRVYDPHTGSECTRKYTKPELAAFRQAAIFVSGGYKGPLYHGALHIPPSNVGGGKWRRVVFDEVQDLLEASSSASEHSSVHSASSTTQNNFIQLTRSATNVWLMSATPFPKADSSVYGINQLLGIKRLRLQCAHGENPVFEVPALRM